MTSAALRRGAGENTIYVATLALSKLMSAIKPKRRCEVIEYR